MDTLLMPVHIVGGSVAIVAGYVALFTGKGSTVHRRTGTWFVVAMIVIKWFLGIVSRHGFAPFAWYRIVIGTVALVWLLAR